MNETKTNARRGFLAKIGTGLAAVGLATLSSPLQLFSQQKPMAEKKMAAGTGPDQWFKQIKGSHRVVYDAPRPHDIFPFAWPRVFLTSNQATGTPETDCGVVVVLRHNAIGYAFKDPIWAKYNLAEAFKAQDHGPAFKAADAAVATKTRNPFWNTNPGDFMVPGIGAVSIGIKDLQASGVMFCVCNAAITVNATAIASRMNMKPEDVLNEWRQELIPGIEVVPSGVWALGRAQENGCQYIFAG